MRARFKIILLVFFFFILTWLVTYNIQDQNSALLNDTNSTQPADGSQKNISSSYPIILVHGWMGKAIDYQSYALKFQEQGIAENKGIINRYSIEAICQEKWPKAIVVSAEYYYDDNLNHGIEDYAKELDHDVRLVMNCTGSDQVILLAHSMGGLVSRKYMVDYGNEHVKKLITLGTPHYGFNNFTNSEIIMMALNLFTKRELEVKQMIPGSDFLKELDAADANQRDKIVSIGTYVITNNTQVFGLPVLSSKIKDFEQLHFTDSDIIVKLDSTQLAGTKKYQIIGCSHTQITNFRLFNTKGSILDAYKCTDAYDIVKKEVLMSR
jgi:pimeloyl-ACP methyl ester carboxylesterase